MKRSLLSSGIVILALFLSTTPAIADDDSAQEGRYFSSSSITKPRVIYGYRHPTMQGWEVSFYKGKYYVSSQEEWRKCVQHRESRFRYGAQNKTSTAKGAYQFLDSQWRDSLAHMVYPELIEMHGKYIAKDIKEKLFSQPISKWSRAIQDQAFYTVLNYNGKWSGKKHWSLQFNYC